MAYKIAFHLARGAHFQHWQIKGDDGQILYFNPSSVDLVLHSCTLHNQKAASLKIYKGGDKARCAWVSFESFDVLPAGTNAAGTPVRFNPRSCPTWQVNGQPEQDGRKFARLTTSKQFISL
jgi:hypothetical protein